MSSKDVQAGFYPLHEWFLSQNNSLSLAESCTGGTVAASIVQFPGASRYFCGGVVAYSDQMKKQMLGVKEKTLKSFGAESVECAVEMASGICLHTGATYGVSVTGFAGPGGGTRVGCVWIAVQQGAHSLYCEQHYFPGDRKGVIEQATREVFHVLHNLFLDP